MRILTVVVRYKTPLEESRTIRSLAEAFRTRADLAETYQVLIWDNSPVTADCRELPIPCLYSHTGENLGVSGAYNGAMQLALENDYPWMLLFDQDTTVETEFLSAMITCCQELLPRTEIAAIAPTVRAGGRVVSPTRRRFGRVRCYPEDESGTAPGEASAINSGCVLRTSALQSIGGYSEDFWLDYSDIYVFHQFALRGLKLWRAAELKLQHELSMMDYANQMTPWRCRNFTLAESAFHDCYSGSLENAVLTLRLFARAIKHRIKYQNSQFSRIAWKVFLFRLLERRANRIRREFAALRYRQIQAGGAEEARVFYD